MLKEKIKNLLADKKFSEILTGSAFSLSSRVFGTGISVLISSFVARIYGPNVLGILTIVQSILMISSIFGLFGANTSILRIIPEHSTKFSISSAFFAYKKAYIYVIFFSILSTLIVVIGSSFISNQIFCKPYLFKFILLSGFFILFKSLMDFTIDSMRGLKLVKLYALFQILPNFLLLFLLVFASFIYKNDSLPIYLQLITYSICSIIASLLIYLNFKKSINYQDIVCRFSFLELLVISYPMLMTSVMNFVTAQMGVLILGMYRPVEEVGFYSVAVKLAMLTSFILHAINSIAAPKFSELFNSGNHDDLFYIAKKSTRLVFWATTPVLAFLIICGSTVLNLFGESFNSAYFPMLILLLGQFINSISGSTGVFLSMTGNQIVLRNIIGIACIINLVLSFALIPSLGSYGAAITFTVSLAFWNIVALVYIRKKHGQTIGYLPWPRSFLVKSS